MTAKKNFDYGSALRKTMLAVSLGMRAYSYYKSYSDQYKVYRESKNFVVTVPESAHIYRDLINYVNSGNATGKNFKLHVEPGQRVTRQFDTGKESIVNIDGHMLKASVRLLDNDAPKMDNVNLAMVVSKGIVFTTDSEAAVGALERFISDLSDQKNLEYNPPSLYTPQNNYWNGNALPRRDIDSIILREGYKEDLLADMERFEDSEDRYLKMGIPWHRGYLLYGPPGNGKSSIAMSIANKYAKNLYVLSPNGVKNDAQLNTLINDVERNSLLLIEDIDVFSSSVTRDMTSDGGPTLAGLLNALDGVFTPHGLITMITTNRLEALDEALVRPGRIDYRLHLEAPTDEQIERAFRHIYEEPLGVKPRQFPSMASFMGIIKRHHDDPTTARLEVSSEFDMALPT